MGFPTEVPFTTPTNMEAVEEVKIERENDEGAFLECHLSDYNDV